MTFSVAASKQGGSYRYGIGQLSCSVIPPYSVLAILHAIILLCLGCPSYDVPIFLPGVCFCRGCYFIAQLFRLTLDIKFLRLPKLIQADRFNFTCFLASKRLRVSFRRHAEYPRVLPAELRRAFVSDVKGRLRSRAIAVLQDISSFLQSNALLKIKRAQRSIAGIFACRSDTACPKFHHFAAAQAQARAELIDRHVKSEGSLWRQRLNACMGV